MKAKTKKLQFSDADPFLEAIVNELIKKYKCHTVLLYGSRARGDATEKSDYDLMGVRRAGRGFRLAEKRDGKYLDIFVYSEIDLEHVGEEFLHMKSARVLVEINGFGARFLRRLNAIAKRKYRPLPPDEIQTRRVWAHKMLERISVGDIEGNYRRSWLHEALLSDYFAIRKMRYAGSKEGFAWLRANDRPIYKLFDQVLQRPTDLKLLKKLVERVTELKIK